MASPLLNSSAPNPNTKQHASLPTARADSQTQTRCLEVGFDQFYRKPVTRTVVETILEDGMNDFEKNES